MYELKKIGKVIKNKFVGTGPSFYKKKNLLGRSLTKVEKEWRRELKKIPPQYRKLSYARGAKFIKVNNWATWNKEHRSV